LLRKTLKKKFRKAKRSLTCERGFPKRKNVGGRKNRGESGGVPGRGTEVEVGYLKKPVANEGTWKEEGV